MDFQPKPEPTSSTSHESFNEMSISKLVSDLRANFDKVEEVFFAREAKHKAEIGSLAVKYELERLQRLHIEDELEKKQQAYLNLERKWSELEEENKKNMEAIQKLKDENSRLEKEKCNADAEKHLNEIAAVPDPSLSKKRKKGAGHCIDKSSDVDKLNQKWHIAALDFKKVKLEANKKEKRGRLKKLEGPKPKALDSRCSPSSIADLFAALEENPTKLQEIEAIGFNSLRQIAKWFVKQDIVLYLATNYNIERNCLMTDIDEINVTSTIIARILGLPSHGDDFPKLDKRNPEHQKIKDTWAGKSTTKIREFVINCPVETQRQRVEFRRAFLLIVVKTFLCPTTTSIISPDRHLPPILEVDNPMKFNWTYQILHWLRDGIRDFQQRGVFHIGGCTFVLIILYFQRLKHGRLDICQAPEPWISEWDTEKLDAKAKVVHKKVLST
ncbi:hypothetical protein PIB30_047521 [Stylosanthes scabra]|uniref:Uncharacterized protein n=1 Tax=Stylosanthes scabra TaxID=79078 RepID=A0ABU6XFT7_9FABA|nr:hypothetical protein [Stylosanthes scabra]